MLRSGWLSALVLGMGVFGFAGCGSSAPPAGGTAPAPIVQSNLNGNWLLAGVLPTQPLTSGGNFGFAMSFAVNGSEVLGSGSAQFVCNGVNTGFTFGALVHGTIAADGTFTAKAPTSVNGGGLNVVVTGTVPKIAAGAWSGTYTLESAPLGLATACTFSQSANFTASPIANVSGKYVGTGTLSLPLGQQQTNAPVTVTMNLQQGGTVTSTAGVSSYDALLLSGTVQVAGTSCFTSGVLGPFTGAPATSAGSVEGSQVIGTFTMDDGSRMLLGGNLADTAASKIADPFLLVTGGTCAAAANTSVVVRLTELDKVS